MYIIYSTKKTDLGKPEITDRKINLMTRWFIKWNKIENFI